VHGGTIGRAQEATVDAGLEPDNPNRREVEEWLAAKVKMKCGELPSGTVLD
jgi:hypothetical protein